MAYNLKDKKMNKIQIANSRELIKLGLAVLAVFVVAIWHIQGNYSLKLWGDEFGYWQAAAYITGKDWSSIASTNVYYGYGFGILLAPIMLIFGHNSVLMLQAALALEAVMLSSCVVAAYLCIGYFSDRVQGNMKILLAVLPVLYPSNVLYVNLSLSEILLVTLMWWYTYAALKFIEKKQIRLAVVLVVLSVYMYSVHQRTIAVMLVSFLLVVWVYRKKVLTPRLLFVLAIFVCGIALVVMFKRIYVNNMYVQVREVASVANGMAVPGSKVVRILTTFDGLKNFVLSLIGKYYYLSASTAMLAVLGFWHCVRSSFVYVKEKRDWERLSGLLVIGLNFAGAFLINSIYMSDEFISRTDILIYGRYMEHTIGPLIILGVIYLYENSDIKTVLALISLSGIAAVIVGRTIAPTALNENMWAHSSALADLFTSRCYENGEALSTALIRSFIFLTILYVGLKLKKFFAEGSLILALFCLCIAWTSIGYKVRNERVIPWADELYRDQTEVLSYIDEEEFGIYQSYVGGFFQFLRVDAKVINYDRLEDIEDVPHDMYIITYTKAQDIKEIRREHEIVFENKRYVLWRAFAD